MITPESRPVIIADRLKTPENMGSIFRLASNIDARLILFVENEFLDAPRWRKVKRNAASAFEKTEWKFVNGEELSQHIPEGYKVVSIETSTESTLIYDTKLPEKIAFVVGNERHGIGQDVLEISDQVVHIPVPGLTSSLNVSHALAIGIFEWIRQVRFNDKE